MLPVGGLGESCMECWRECDAELRDSSKYRMVRWLYEVETSAMVWKERLSDRFY